MNSFDNVKKKLGFGCMRLPMKGEEVDLDEFSRMVDLYMEAGFNYFDTARVYIDGKSETAIRDCIVKRYPRESFILADKLSHGLFESAEEIRPLFEKQLLSCGVDYFDIYLMHAQTKSLYEKYKSCRAYEQVMELKAEGKIKHFGISFHDTAQVLDEILTEYPQIEVVQLQINYLDYDDPAVQGRLCYEVCRKHEKPVIVMEPVKGGNLAQLPEDARAVLDGLGGGSAASYAIRFAAGLDGILTVLSGMSNTEQMIDNISYMKNFQPLSSAESAAVLRVCEIFRSMQLIPCTSCRYCTGGCPANILIPDLLACMNAMQLHHSWNSKYYYDDIYTKRNGKAGDCKGCGKCEKACPQHLPIRELLKKVSQEFDRH